MTSLPILSFPEVFTNWFLYHYISNSVYVLSSESVCMTKDLDDTFEPLYESRHIGDEFGMSATGTLGRIEEFDGNKDDWLQYVERLEYFLLANEIVSPEKK